MNRENGIVWRLAAFVTLAFCFGCEGGKSANTPAAERQVLDDDQVTAFVECVNRDLRQYKFRFVIKKPGSRFVAAILRMAGNPDAHSVVVNGVDSDNVGFAFSPKIAVFDKNLQAVPANYETRPLNSDDELGQAYHELVLKYEKGN